MEILYEDNDVVAVNKPSGLVVHLDGRTKESSVADWVAKEYPTARGLGEPEVSSSGETLSRPGIVHRLDRDTSGVLLIAKSKPGFLSLQKQFENREVKKIYHAFVYGNLKDEGGTIDRPIGRSRKDFRLRSAGRGASGRLREAVTNYKVLKHDKDFAFVEISPQTGRTHQIRAHFKAINHPVVCDKLYAPKHEPILGFKRLALHARSIEFKNLARETIKIEAPYPEDFEEAVKFA